MGTVLVFIAIVGGTVGFMYLLIKASMLLNRGSSDKATTEPSAKIDAPGKR